MPNKRVDVFEGSKDSLNGHLIRLNGIGIKRTDIGWGIFYRDKQGFVPIKNALLNERIFRIRLVVVFSQMQIL